PGPRRGRAPPRPREVSGPGSRAGSVIDPHEERSWNRLGFEPLLVACSRECFSEGFRSARRLRRPMPVAVRAISRKTMCEVQPGLASPAQRRIERQPGGREPEMMQKHDLEARVLECAAGLPGGI